MKIIKLAQFSAKKIALTLVLLSGGLPAVSTFAEDIYTPANFAFKGVDLAQLIEVPSGSFAVTLYCRTNIDIAGKAARAQCYDSEGNRDIELQTQIALSQLAFKPATVNGSNVPVRMSFRVAYAGHDAGLNTILIPNLGTMQSRYGRDYIEPQERLDVSDWYEAYSKSSWVNGGEFLSEGPMARVAATVAEDGKPEMVRTVDAGRAYIRDADVVKSVLRRSRFIPGFVGDKPVPMGYVAVVNYGESNETIGSR